MRRRYRGGTLLSKREFVDQEWVCGMLMFRDVEGRPQLGLWESVPGYSTGQLGILWRPELVACALDTISFAGTEQVNSRWCYQVWFCETHDLPPSLSLELLLRSAATSDHEPN